MTDVLVSLGMGYLLGSIPGAYLISKYIFGVDITRHGSGNPGATNALRVLGFKAGLPGFLFDMFKGMIAVVVCKALFGETAGVAAATGALLGHSFSFFLKGRGGKSVATTFGCILALFGPKGGLFFSGIWLSVVAAVGIVSLASMISSWSFVLWSLAAANPWGIGWSVFAAGLITLRHSSNIRRLLKGQEKRIFDDLKGRRKGASLPEG